MLGFIKIEYNFFLKNVENEIDGPYKSDVIVAPAIWQWVDEIQSGIIFLWIIRNQSHLKEQITALSYFILLFEHLDLKRY